RARRSPARRRSIPSERSSIPRKGSPRLSKNPMHPLIIVRVPLEKIGPLLELIRDPLEKIDRSPRKDRSIPWGISPHYRGTFGAEQGRASRREEKRCAERAHAPAEEVPRGRSAGR